MPVTETPASLCAGRESGFVDPARSVSARFPGRVSRRRAAPQPFLVALRGPPAEPGAQQSDNLSVVEHLALRVAAADSGPIGPYRPQAVRSGIKFATRKSTGRRT